MANTYTAGNTVTLQGIYETQPDPPTDPITYLRADPSSVIAQIRDPAGVLTVYTFGTDENVIRLSTGLYILKFVPNRKGTWLYRWIGVGSVGADEWNSIRILGNQI